MTAKKRITFLTFGLCIVLFVSILHFRNLGDQLYYDLAMAAFGSALLGFLMTIIEYFSERKRAMESFLKASYKFTVALRNIKYIDFEEPKELLLSCIAEEQHNAYIESLSPETAKALGLSKEHTHRDEYISWMEENEVMSFSEDDDQYAILSEIYSKRMNDYKDEIVSAIQLYLDISKISIEDLSDSYGNLNFLFGNKEIRNKAYKEIYHILVDCHNKILLQTFHFNMLNKKSVGNFVACANGVLELNEYFFETRVETGGDINVTSIYHSVLDNVSESIEVFREKTYFNKVSSSFKRTPVLSKYNMIDFEKQGS